MLNLTKENHLQLFNLISEFKTDVTFRRKDNVLISHSGDSKQYIRINQDSVGEDFIITIPFETFQHIHRILKTADIKFEKTENSLKISAKNYENEYALLEDNVKLPSFVNFEKLFTINRGELFEGLEKCSHTLKEAVKTNKIFLGFNFLVKKDSFQVLSFNTKELAQYNFKSTILEDFTNEQELFCVPATLFSLVKNIPDSTLDISLKSNKVLINTDSGITIVLSLLVGEYPPNLNDMILDMTSEKPDLGYTEFNLKDFVNALDSTMFFAENTKQFAVLLSFEDNNAIISSAGSKGKSVVKIPTIYPEGQAEVILPGHIIKNLVGELTENTLKFQLDTKLRKLYVREGNLNVMTVLLRKV